MTWTAKRQMESMGFEMSCCFGILNEFSATRVTNPSGMVSTLHFCCTSGKDGERLREKTLYKWQECSHHFKAQLKSVGHEFFT